MYAVRYTADNDIVLIAYVKANSAEQARRLAYSYLMSIYKNFNIIEVESTNMNVFVNPQRCCMAFD